MTSPFALTELQRDALRELANVGAGHAATSLSQLLSGERLSFQAPEAWAGTAEAFQAKLEPEAPWLAGVRDVHGDVRARLWLLFGQKDSQALAAQLFAKVPKEEASVELAVQEATQAMGTSALAAMGRLTGLAFASRKPVLQRSRLSAAMAKETASAEVLALQVRLRAPTFAALFLFLPEGPSLRALLRALRV